MDFLTASDLPQADLHRLLIEPRLFTHTPAQIDRLKPATMPHAQLTQSGKDVLLQRAPLSLQITEG